MTAQIINFPINRERYRGWAIKRSPTGMFTATSPDFGYHELTDGYGIQRGELLVECDTIELRAQIDAAIGHAKVREARS
ncbi:hypothetical protein [Novosphingobium sp. HII-3]|uniref:hypothetical protein n=1 Tax=Novosphingobium sp. HII-3 TaxID=2075565 RepID=UPI000CDB7CEF|nr:hypothetical protein [Novosphingobium sp. HII-3]